MNDNNVTRSTGEKDILLEEYKILVDLRKHHYIRSHNWDRTFLAVNTILVGACAVILRENPSQSGTFLIYLCILGITVSIVWLLVASRIIIDIKLNYFQLRSCERALEREPGIFTSGYKFFFDKETLCDLDGNEMEFPKGFLHKFRVVWASKLLPLLFMFLYGALILIEFKQHH